MYFLFPVCPDRGHTARSIPGRCVPLQRNRGTPSMLPVPLIVSLGLLNTVIETLRGRGNGIAAGPSSRLLFLPYRVCLITLVTLVVFFLFGVAENAILASSEELPSSAAMASLRSAPAQGNPHPSFSPGAVRSDFSGSDYIPLRGYVTGPRWTMGAVHGRSVSRSMRTMVDQANPSTPRGPRVGQRRGQPRTAGGFAL